MTEIRPLRWPDEIPLWAAVHCAAHPENPFGTAEFRRWHGNRKRAGYFLAFEGADAVGFGWAARRPDSALPDGRVVVVPGHRERGIGSALFAAIVGPARAHGFRELGATVDEAHREAREFAAHRGFVETGRVITSALDLHAVEPAAGRPLEGIEIVTLADRPELKRQLYEIDREAIPDIPGEEDYRPPPLEEWLARPTKRPEGIFLAVTIDGEAVGYAQLSFPASQPATANHDETSVRRAWRGRGIAAALKARQIQWARAAGYERLVTSNEERNAPIRRLNERLGYRPVATDLLLRGPVA